MKMGKRKHGTGHGKPFVMGRTGNKSNRSSTKSEIVFFVDEDSALYEKVYDQGRDVNLCDSEMWDTFAIELNTQRTTLGCKGFDLKKRWIDEIDPHLEKYCKLDGIQLPSREEIGYPEGKNNIDQKLTFLGERLQALHDKVAECKKPEDEATKPKILEAECNEMQKEPTEDNIEEAEYDEMQDEPLVHNIKTRLKLKRTFKSEQVGNRFYYPDLPKQIFNKQSFFLVEYDLRGGRDDTSEAIASCHEYLIKLHGGKVLWDTEELTEDTFVIASHDDEVNVDFSQETKLVLYSPSLIYEHTSLKMFLDSKTSIRHHVWRPEKDVCRSCFEARMEEECHDEIPESTTCEQMDTLASPAIVPKADDPRKSEVEPTVVPSSNDLMNIDYNLGRACFNGGGEQKLGDPSIVFPRDLQGGGSKADNAAQPVDKLDQVQPQASNAVVMEDPLNVVEVETGHIDEDDVGVLALYGVTVKRTLKSGENEIQSIQGQSPLVKEAHDAPNGPTKNLGCGDSVQDFVDKKKAKLDADNLKVALMFRLAANNTSANGLGRAVAAELNDKYRVETSGRAIGQRIADIAKKQLLKIKFDELKDGFGLQDSMLGDLSKICKKLKEDSPSK